jgi:L-iditol 2-dehydrogenase
LQALRKLSNASGDAQLVECEVEPLVAGHARIAVLATGVCGTDLHIVDGEYPVAPPVTMGHEVVGDVVAVGDGVDPGWLGVRVSCETFHTLCGECRWCRDGRPNLCPKRGSIGTHNHGGFAPLMNLPVRNLHRVPSRLSPAAATLMEPLACVCQALLDPTLVSASDQVLVTGPGAIGLLAAQVAQLQGAEVTLVGRDSDADRLALARDIGIGTAVKPAADEYDVTIDASGSAVAIEVCLQALRRGGRHIQLGIVGRPATINLDLVLFKELTLTSGFASTPQSWRRAELLVAGAGLRLEPLVSAVIPLQEWEDAFEAVRGGAGVKVVIDPS